MSVNESFLDCVAFHAEIVNLRPGYLVSLIRKEWGLEQFEKKVIKQEEHKNYKDAREAATILLSNAV